LSKQKYATVEVIHKLRDPAAANALLQNAVAELTVDKIILREVASGERNTDGRGIRLRPQYGRYGYWQIAELQRQEGWDVRGSPLERIWKLEGLRVPEKQPKRGRL
jgi:hypothetical protein